MKFDVVVVGSGPGGYVAAIRASQLGLKTAVVEREHLGGICLNWGCIPTKALLRSAEVFDFIRHAGDYGLAAENAHFNLEEVVKRSRSVSERLNRGVAGLLKKNKVQIIWGEAALTAPGQLRVSEPNAELRRRQSAPAGALGPGDYSADHIIIATGARPKPLIGLEPDGELVWTYFEAMVPATVPTSLIVVGAGAIGVEFASFFATLGAKVTVVEAVEQILPMEDPEIATFARKQFEKQGIKIVSGAIVTAVKRGRRSLVATVEHAGEYEEIAAERMLVAAGVQGNIENLGLDVVGARTERGCVVVDGLGRTNVVGLYAIGDVAGPPMLAHKAEHEGVVCVEAIKGLHPHPVDKTRVPSCTYARPQIASVGLTEERARSTGRELRIGRFPFAANGKAIALGEDQGLVKTIFDAKTGELLGAHMVGAEVTELIQGFVVAIGLETTEAELMRTVFPHPTLSETMHESALDAFGLAIHK